MNEYHVRVSTLEAYRKLRSGQEYGPTEAELVDAIRNGQANQPGEWYQQCGTAFHAVMAGPQRWVDQTAPAGVPLDCYTCDGWTFQGEDVRLVLGSVPNGQCEQTKTRRFVISHLSGFLDVSGTADLIGCGTVFDYKTTFSPINVEKYERSYQWRFYLLIHGMDIFQYEVVQLERAHDEDFSPRIVNRDSFRFWSYPQMENDCRELCSNFMFWAENLGLLDHLAKGVNRGEKH
jgi:hypothetical protein